MRDNQLSKFDTRLIRFDKNNKLRILYSLDKPDITISRGGNFYINNERDVRKDFDKVANDTVFYVNKNGMQKSYTLSFLMNFIHYGNCDKCFCECKDDKTKEL